MSSADSRAAPRRCTVASQIVIREDEGRQEYVSIGLCNLSDALRLAGGLREAEAAARRGLVITRQQGDRFEEAVSLYWLGLALAARGVAQAVRVCAAAVACDLFDCAGA